MNKDKLIEKLQKDPDDFVRTEFTVNELEAMQAIIEEYLDQYDSLIVPDHVESALDKVIQLIDQTESNDR